jgi:signal transduction histidine kinase
MTVTRDHPTTVGVSRRPLRRQSTNAVLGGVCAGLALRLGLRETLVRIGFVMLAAVFGLGLIVYMLMWLGTPRVGEDQSIGLRLANKKREAEAFLLSVAVVIILLIGLYSLDLRATAAYAWSVLLSALGVGAIWRGASLDERRQLSSIIGDSPFEGTGSARGWRSIVLRVVPGVAMAVVGLEILGQVGGTWRSFVPVILGSAALVVGILILLAPWWLQTARALTRERRDRVRAEERATMAAHIHDSVLQTLTLIERVAANEDEVVRLARAQERALRQWLFDPRSPTEDAGSTLASLAREIEQDVEGSYGVRVELVVVGDCPVDDDVVALAAAGKEAAINAAKWSGAGVVSIFVEVESHQVTMFVRDTGVGFDPAAIAGDRHGIALSIRQRMGQHGGEAVVKSEPGSGTEVQLTLPLKS